MSIENTRDYMAAVAKRQRLERIFRDEARRFSGYGRELFERGLSKSLEDLNAAISDYEVRLGYTPMAPYNFWTTQIKEECICITKGASFERRAPSIACPETAGAAYLQKTPREVGSKQVELPVAQHRWELLSSLLLPRSVPAGVQ